MNRIDRLHAILTHLQSKKRVTAQHIADRFNISLRTVYRDIRALNESGVPVIGEAGTGYSIMEGYRLPPVMFTQEEAAALLFGAKLVQKMTDLSVQKNFDDALYKIQAVLRSADREFIEQLLPNVEVSVSGIPVHEPASRHLSLLQKAVAGKQVVHLRYRSNYDSITERDIEPVGLWHYGQNWHLIGWCRLRNEYRDFRVNRMLQAQLKEETFTSRSYESLKDYISSFSDISTYVQEAVILMDKEVTRHLSDARYQYGFVKQEDLGDKVRMHFLTSSFEYFGRWLLMFTDAVTIESPEPLQKIMQSLTNELAGHYK